MTAFDRKWLALPATKRFLRGMDVRVIFFSLGCALTGCVRMSQSEPGTHLVPPDRQSALDEVIDVNHLDRPLLAQAIFDETNRVRAGYGLRPFHHLPKLDEAAGLEATMGRVFQPPSHTNPFPVIGTPKARVEYVGLDAARVAENIAVQYAFAGNAVTIVSHEGKRTLIDPGTNTPVRLATYREFAAKVLVLWMDSPGHRANLVDPDLQYLGCSAEAMVTISGVDQLFCVQVFFTPAGSASVAH